MTACLCVPRTSASAIYPLATSHCLPASLPRTHSPLRACLPSSSQHVVELRRFHLAGAGEVGRLNYIFIGNPGTGKVCRVAPICTLPLPPVGA